MSEAASKTKPEQEPLDPVYVHSKRETYVLLVAFVVFLVWCISVSWFLGYGQPEDVPLRTIWGIPHWVFWGIGVPWMAANVFTLLFSFFYVANDPLGTAEDESNEVAPKHIEGDEGAC